MSGQIESLLGDRELPVFWVEQQEMLKLEYLKLNIWVILIMVDYNL